MHTHTHTHTHTAQKEIAHECVCVYLRSMHVSAQKHTITSTALIYTPVACTHQHQNNKTPAPAQKNTLISTALTHQNKHAKKKYVHTNISKMHTPGGLRTIHIHMHMLRTIHIHIRMHMLSTIHRAKKKSRTTQSEGE